MNAAELRRLRQDSAGWRLLASDLAPVAIAVLSRHLFEEQRRLPSTVLLERLRRDLDALRDAGADLPRPPESYLAAWLGSGFVERRFDAGASEEEYELSAQALQAIEFVNALSERRAIATESRLALVVEQLRQLAEQSETDASLRLQALEADRARIDRQIEAVRAGHFEVLSDEQATERAREVLALARELGNDFRRVREEFNTLNRSLREQLLDSQRNRGDVLEQLFAGVDVIAEGEAGRTFRAFWRLLTNPEQSATLDGSLDRILGRDFARTLTREERALLLGLTGTLLDRGGEVHEVLQNFARSLKQFVQSQEFREQRRLVRMLELTERRALSLRDQLGPTTNVDHTLWLSSANIRSVGQWRLAADDSEFAADGMAPAAPLELSLDAIGELVAQSEIDFRRLRRQLRELLTEREAVTIADVLERYPAGQGLGTVVGLLALGVQHGVRSKQFDTVRWQGNDGQQRGARIPRMHFTRDAIDALR